MPENHVWISEKLSLKDKWEHQSMDTNRKTLVANVSTWQTAQGGKWRIVKYMPVRGRPRNPEKPKGKDEQRGPHKGKRRK